MLDGEPLKKAGLMCFLNFERPCSAECMSFVDPPEGPDYEGKQWANCHLLVNAHRAGKHLTILAQTTGELVKKTKTQMADQQRLSQPPPPGVK